MIPFGVPSSPYQGPQWPFTELTGDNMMIIGELVGVLAILYLGYRLYILEFKNDPKAK